MADRLGALLSGVCKSCTDTSAPVPVTWSVLSVLCRAVPCRAVQVSAIQQERQGTEGLVAELGRQSGALEAWLASHEWKADAVAAALAKGSTEPGALDINKVIVPTGQRHAGLGSCNCVQTVLGCALFARVHLRLASAVVLRWHASICNIQQWGAVGPSCRQCCYKLRRLLKCVALCTVLCCAMPCR